MPYASREKQLAYFNAYNEKRRASLREYMHEYNKTRDPVENRERGKKYREEYGDVLYAKRKESRASDPTAVRARELKYYHRNKDIRDEKARLWKKVNKEKVAGYDHKRRASMKGAPVVDFTNEQWSLMKYCYGYMCAYCGKKQQRLSQDHMVPLSKGGSHTASNIVPACRSCNSKKGAGPRIEMGLRFSPVTECA